MFLGKLLSSRNGIAPKIGRTLLSTLTAFALAGVPTFLAQGSDDAVGSVDKAVVEVEKPEVTSPAEPEPTVPEEPDPTPTQPESSDPADTDKDDEANEEDQAAEDSDSTEADGEEPFEEEAVEEEEELPESILEFLLAVDRVQAESDEFKGIVRENPDEVFLTSQYALQSVSEVVADLFTEQDPTKDNHRELNEAIDKAREIYADDLTAADKKEEPTIEGYEKLEDLVAALINESDEAKIGDVGYPTLQDAIDKSGDYERVTLLKDVTANISIARKNVIVDLGEYFIDGGEAGVVISITGWAERQKIGEDGEPVFDQTTHKPVMVLGYDPSHVTLNATTGGVRNGKTTPNDDGQYYQAGGIYVYDSVFTMNGGFITNNIGGLAGGFGIETYGEKVEGKIASATLNEVTIEGNEGWRAGGACAWSPLDPEKEEEILACTATLNLNGCTVKKNFAKGIGGVIGGVDYRCSGGVCAAYNATVNIDGGSIEYNEGPLAGGIYLLNIKSKEHPSELNEEVQTSATVSNCKISNNKATQKGAGGVYLQPYTSFTMTNGSITKNEGSLAGGIYVVGDDTYASCVHLENVDIEENTSKGYSSGEEVAGVGGINLNGNVELEMPSGIITGNTGSTVGGVNAPKSIIDDLIKKGIYNPEDNPTIPITGPPPPPITPPESPDTIPSQGDTDQSKDIPKQGAAASGKTPDLSLTAQEEATDVILGTQDAQAAAARANIYDDMTARDAYDIEKTPFIPSDNNVPLWIFVSIIVGLVGIVAFVGAVYVRFRVGKGSGYNPFRSR